MPQGQKHLKTEEDDDLQGSINESSSSIQASSSAISATAPLGQNASSSPKKKEDDPNRKRRKVCDGNLPACAACASVYGTECIYDPNSDHRRKGVYKKDIDNLKTRNSTLQTLIQAILNYPEDKVLQLVYDIRNCESLDDVAAKIIAQGGDDSGAEDESDLEERNIWDDTLSDAPPSLESDISEKLGSLQIDSLGQVKFVGATSVLGLLPMGMASHAMTGDPTTPMVDNETRIGDPMISWTEVTKDRDLIIHLMNMYFTWHYPYFTTLSKRLFFKDFLRGNPGKNSPESKTTHCTPLLVNAMLALGCHFTAVPGSRKIPSKPETAGDHFFQEAKRLIMENDEHEHPRLPTTQALALMSVREAGCGREARGWVYSGMSFRMACDLGLQWNPDGLPGMSDEEIDARKITFWGCFLFDKCWSNYTGRLPQLPAASTTTPKYDVFPDEDSELWTPYTDNGLTPELSQPGRTRAVALHLIGLCEISNEILLGFYQPVKGGTTKESKLGKGRAGKDAEMKRLLELYNRLEEWNQKLPMELGAKEGALPNVLLMHMFCQLLYLLLFRPFFKVNPGSVAFPANLSPKRICINASTTISKVLRLYKRTYGLKQICNIAVYIALSACTIHLMNLPTKAAKRDIVQGVKCLEEIADYWLCGKRALIIVKVLSIKYSIELPEEAEVVLSRIDTSGEMFGFTIKDMMGSSPKPSSPPVPRIRPPGAPPAGAMTATSSNGSPAAVMQVSPAMRPVTSMSTPEFNAMMSSDPALIAAAAPQLVPQTSVPMSSASIATTSLFTPYFDPGASPSSTSTAGVSRKQINPSSTASPPLAAIAASANANANSPSMYPGYPQLEDQSQDWWLRDQAELAQDFGSWDFSSGTISPEPSFDQFSPPGSVQSYVSPPATGPQAQTGFTAGAVYDQTVYWQ
ncbi:hypothetical protein ABW19_dt0205785 [Dactylella cylindrospora]|nr:hypothetical protein ABW19_dt0205785 [Dactylella cylindrospora]